MFCSILFFFFIGCYSCSSPQQQCGPVGRRQDTYVSWCKHQTPVRFKHSIKLTLHNFILPESPQNTSDVCYISAYQRQGAANPIRGWPFQDKPRTGPQNQRQVGRGRKESPRTLKNDVLQEPRLESCLVSPVVVERCTLYILWFVIKRLSSFWGVSDQILYEC